MKYHITYHYMASGMDFPDKEDYGIWEAENEEEAKEKAIVAKHPIDTKYGPNDSYSLHSFVRACLRSNQIKP